MNKKKSLFIFTGILVFAILIISLITAIGSGGGFKKLPSGLQYKIVLNNASEKAKVGQLMIAYITYKTETDSILFSTYSMPGQTASFPIGKPENMADLYEAFLLLGSKDSGVFYLPSDSIFAGKKMRPAFAVAGSYIHVGIRVDTVINKDDFSKINQNKVEVQKQIDDELIKKYLSDNNIEAEKTEEGLYIVVEKKGVGVNAHSGNEVSVLYTGQLLNEKVFDSSDMGGGEPFTFKLGSHSVIPGWELGLTHFKKGSSGKIFIPSNLAYGEREHPGRIPANSVLIFKIEIVNIK